MIRFAPATHLIDVEHVGRPRAIACAVLETEGGLALVDPGPESSLATLERRLRDAGARLDDVAWLLLTHIHLDHAGATGTILRRHPRVRVYVHGSGAPHLVDPSKLLGSASRLYGEEMGRLWGDVVPVPDDAITTLAGGERLDLGGRRVRVEYTPGHAWHHVAFLDDDYGTAFVGDVTGVRFPGGEVVLPVTPPPEVDLEAWESSLSVVRAWRPERLFLTHFGPALDVERHVAEFAESLEEWGRRVRADLEAGPADPDEAAARFADRVAAELAERLLPDLAGHYLSGAGADWSWRGLARYWSKRRGNDGEAAEAGGAPERPAGP